MTKDFAEMFTPEALQQLFPTTRSDEFFEALFGDASEGAYDISLKFVGNQNPRTYQFELHLKQRPGKCLACNLTYGLPEVFSRHPGLNIKGLAAELAVKLGLDPAQVTWKLGVTKTITSALHSIPLLLSVE